MARGTSIRRRIANDAVISGVPNFERIGHLKMCLFYSRPKGLTKTRFRHIFPGGLVVEVESKSKVRFTYEFALNHDGLDDS